MSAMPHSRRSSLGFSPLECNLDLEPGRIVVQAISHEPDRKLGRVGGFRRNINRSGLIEILTGWLRLWS